MIAFVIVFSDYIRRCVEFIHYIAEKETVLIPEKN